jgi:hypothetical protein
MECPNGGKEIHIRFFVLREENTPEKDTCKIKKGEGRRILEINFRDSNCGKFHSV